MATESSYGQCKMLSAADVKAIVRLAPFAAKELLAEKLGIPPFEDPKDQQKAPFISFIYDNIMFAAEKGFPWEQVCLVVTFAHEFLKKILVENHCLTDAIQDFKICAEIIAPLNDHHQKQYTDFIFETVLCHYNLYKYVFSHLRDEVKPQVTKEIEAPPIPPPLSQGEDVVIWEYKKKVEKVEEEEQKALRKQQEQREELSQLSSEHKTLHDLECMPLPYNKMSLNELVKDILADYTDRKEKELRFRANEVVTDLSYKLEKTAIERPTVLGAPPRFKPKSPIQQSKPNINNSSLKVDKKGNLSARSKSGRASAASGVSKR